MKYAILSTFLILSFFLPIQVHADIIDGQIRSHDGTLREYSLYLPSTYQRARTMPLMISFHPYSRYQWNARTWRDSLLRFAESQQLILLCPDGGWDGLTDQPEDLEISHKLLKQIQEHYRLDAPNIFPMGYSWGARAALRFSLAYPDKINGLLLVNVASDRTAGEFAPIMRKAHNKRIFMLHGQYDSPSTRFQPLYEELLQGGACLNFEIIRGQGHTFSCHKEQSRLAAAFQWIQQSPCYQIPRSDHNKQHSVWREIVIYPNPSRGGESLRITGVNANELRQIRILDHSGILLRVIKHYDPERPVRGLPKGDYVFVFNFHDGSIVSKRVFIN
ncbi:MAG: hypothetical protein AAFQ68_26105 [Bacteroidota bacterium]